MIKSRGKWHVASCCIGSKLPSIVCVPLHMDVYKTSPIGQKMECNTYEIRLLLEYNRGVQCLSSPDSFSKGQILEWCYLVRAI